MDEFDLARRSSARGSCFPFRDAPPSPPKKNDPLLFPVWTQRAVWVSLRRPPQHESLSYLVFDALAMCPELREAIRAFDRNVPG